MEAKIPSQLSDTDLVAEVKRLVQCERESMVSLIHYLAELDARRLYLSAGFPSLFAYCTEVLRLSEHEAYGRIEAARAARKFPLLLDRLSAGRLNLTTLRLLAPHLTADNHQELIAAGSGKSKREVEELLAGYFPRAAVSPSIRKLPGPKPLPAPADMVATTAATRPAEEISGGTLPPAQTGATFPSPGTRRPAVSPLAPDRYQIRFTASAGTREKLRLAQDLLRHAVPDGDTAEIFDRALTALLDDLARKKFAATQRPGPDRPHSPSSRHIPARVKRAVWLRDGGRCAFAAKDGRRCTERGFIEFHHVKPYAVRGEATVDNIQLRCRAHNAHEADLFYSASRLCHGEDVISESPASFGWLTKRPTRSGPSSTLGPTAEDDSETHPPRRGQRLLRCKPTGKARCSEDGGSRAQPGPAARGGVPFRCIS